MGIGSISVIFCSIVIFYFIGFVELFIHHDSGNKAAHFEEKTRISTKTVVSSPAWSDLSVNHTTAQCFQELERSPLSGPFIPCPARERHEGKRSYTVEMLQVHADEEGNCPVLSGLSTPLANLRGHDICASQPQDSQS